MLIGKFNGSRSSVLSSPYSSSAVLRSSSSFSGRTVTSTEKISIELELSLLLKVESVYSAVGNVWARIGNTPSLSVYKAAK